MKVVLPVLLTALLAAGCGSGAEGVTVTVHTATRPAPGGVLYSEGFLPEIRLVDANGEVRKPEDDHVDTAVFDDVAPGTYVLQAAARPCEGNCGILDEPTDGCRRSLRITDAMTARVEFVPSLPCRVEARPSGLGKDRRGCDHAMRVRESDRGAVTFESGDPCPDGSHQPPPG